jgi:hypothetical protein
MTWEPVVRAPGPPKALPQSVDVHLRPSVLAAGINALGAGPSKDPGHRRGERPGMAPGENRQGTYAKRAAKKALCSNILSPTVAFLGVVLAAHQGGVSELSATAFAVGIDVIDGEVVPGEFDNTAGVRACSVR